METSLVTERSGGWQGGWSVLGIRVPFPDAADAMAQLESHTPPQVQTHIWK